MSEIYNIYTSLIYDELTESYKSIICINKMPNGNLKNHIKKINNPKLSPFEIYNNNDYCNSHCLLAIKSFNNCNEFLTPNNIDELFEFMINNNYSVNNEFTNLISKTKNININNKKLIMYIVYN